MKKLIAVFIACSLLIPISSVFASNNSIDDYLRAIEYLNKKDLLSALYFMDKAIVEKDTPELELKSKEGKTVDYLPYYYLGRIYYEMGKWSLALTSFDLSEKNSIIKERPAIYDELKKYRLLVNNKLILDLSKDKIVIPAKEKETLEARKKYMTDEYEITMGESLEETEELNRESREYHLIYAVRKDFNLPMEPIGIYPWYFYYERALKYIEEMQWSEALIYLTESLLRKPIPKENARRYGVWFKDYSPYLYLSFAAIQLHKTTIAKEAFEVSKKYKVIDEKGTIYRQLSLIFKEKG